MGNVMSIVQQKKSTRFLKNSAPQKKISAPREKISWPQKVWRFDDVSKTKRHNVNGYLQES